MSDLELSAFDSGKSQSHSKLGKMKAVRVPKAAETVADHIRSRIINGDLKEGDFLPLESSLLETLGVSRPTLREALRILETERLISITRGSRTGPQVHLPKVEAVARFASYALQSQGTTISDVYEAGLAIEPFAVRQLATRRSPEDVATLRTEIERLVGLLSDDKHLEFIMGLADFHRLIVELSGNKTLLLLSSMLHEIARNHQARVLDDLMKEEGQYKLTLSGVNSFFKLVKLIENGDADGAESHWQLHLKNANKAWLRGQVSESRISISPN